MHWLVKFLVEWFLFAGTMFFADGASALATVGDGGGDADAGGSGGAAGGDGAADGEGDGSGSAEGSGDGAADGSGQGEGEGRAEGEGEGDPNALVDSGDGRKIPAKYKELFDKDKDLRNTYLSYQALRKTFPGGVKEAVALARNVEELGGLEGIEQLQSNLESYSSDAEAFNSGDPKWIENSFKENADVSLKHFANALDFISENHPEHYDHLMAKVIVNDLASIDVRGIHAILAGMKDNPEAQKLSQQLAKYYNLRDQMSRKAPEKQIDPQQRKLDEQAQKLTQREQQVRNKTINADSAPHLAHTIESAVATAAKSAGLDLAKVQKEQPNRWGRFLKDVRNAVHSEVLNDKGWLDRYSKALASNDTAKCVRLLNARHDQAIKGTENKPGVASAIFHEWFGPPKPGTKKAATPSSSSSAASGSSRSSSSSARETPMLVNALPAAKDINYSDPVTDKWAGIYRLKTGKLIQVKRP